MRSGLGWAGLGWAGLGGAGLGWAGAGRGWAGRGGAGLGWNEHYNKFETPVFLSKQIQRTRGICHVFVPALSHSLSCIHRVFVPLFSSPRPLPLPLPPAPSPIYPCLPSPSPFHSPLPQCRNARKSPRGWMCHLAALSWTYRGSGRAGAAGRRGREQTDGTPGRQTGRQAGR